MSDHSPEPWNFVADSDSPSGFPRSCVRANGKTVVGGRSQMDYDHMTSADMERMAACVNFCRGLTNDELTRFGEAGCPARNWAAVMASEAAGQVVSRLIQDKGLLIVKGETP